MSGQTQTERLCEMLDERGVEWADESNGYADIIEFISNDTKWTIISKSYINPEHDWMTLRAEHITPEQAIAATLGDADYERKMDALLCRLTNGKFSKSRAYDLDFMESCVNEEFEKLYEDELVDAALGSVKLTAEQVREVIERHSIESLGCRRQFRERDWQAIADELNALLGSGMYETEARS